jgi:hypothetical protein
MTTVKRVIISDLSRESITRLKITEIETPFSDIAEMTLTETATPFSTITRLLITPLTP